jgi:hypothetical protein
MTAATAAAHVMANALNSLAHAGAGLDVAAALARAVPCYQLDSGDLRSAAQTLRKILASSATAV